MNVSNLDCPCGTRHWIPNKHLHAIVEVGKATLFHWCVDLAQWIESYVQGNDLIMVLTMDDLPKYYVADMEVKIEEFLKAN